MFAVLFSALVASAFNVIYLARNASSMRVLDLESFLCIPLKPFVDYQTYAAHHAEASFYLTFLFMPLLAIGSLAYVAYCVDWKFLWSGPRGAKARGVMLSVSLAGSFIAILSSSFKTMDSIDAFMEWKPDFARAREYTSLHPWALSSTSAASDAPILGSSVHGRGLAGMWANIDWVAVGAIGEIVGALGVVVSLLYVAVQVRQNARATRAQTARESVAGIRHFNEAMVMNPAAARVFRLGAEGLSRLDEEERTQFAHIAFIFFMTAEDLHFQYIHGALDADVWQGWRTVLAVYGTSPGFKEYWSKRSAFFAPAFRSEYESWEDPGIKRVDQFVREAGSTSSNDRG